MTLNWQVVGNCVHCHITRVTHGRESSADRVTPTFSRHADDDQLLGRAQEWILRNDDTHARFLQHCPLEEVAQSIRRIPTTGPFGQLSVPE